LSAVAWVSMMRLRLPDADATSPAAASLSFAACRWVQAECRGLGEHDAPEVDPTLTSAVAALRDRPVLFKYCAEEVRPGSLAMHIL
jgi:hypothetical protein